ncbi:MAG: hypothetical protein QM726_20000 [Chitinophagaceae bacterium]
MKHFKQNLSALILTTLMFISLAGCSKDSTDNTPTVYPIQGLWEGTFTEGTGFTDPPGTTFYFSLSIYPNGTFSYKSGSNTAGLFVYAAGTWTLTGTTFSFSGKTINGVGSTQDNITGSASFDTNAGALNNGTAASNTAGTTGTWKMTRVK